MEHPDEDQKAVSNIIENYKKEEQNMIERARLGEVWRMKCEKSDFMKYVDFDDPELEHPENFALNDVDISEDMEKVRGILQGK